MYAPASLEERRLNVGPLRAEARIDYAGIGECLRGARKVNGALQLGERAAGNAPACLADTLVREDKLATSVRLILYRYTCSAHTVPIHLFGSYFAYTLVR